MQLDKQIRGYEIRDEIGRGGFGVVYRATQAVLKREVALKAILPQYANAPDFIRRFEREAEIIASLEHPHIVPLFDYWRDPEGAFLVMRFVSGGSLEYVQKETELSLEQIVTIYDHVGMALHAAHRKHVVHRDIKPGNVLLDEDFNAYLTDFGIAKSPRFDSETGSGLTGTLFYAAPEQIDGTPITPATDIYAFGVMLHETLAGIHPMQGMQFAEVMYAILEKPLPNIQARRPELPQEFDNIIQRATTKDPAARYTDVHEMVQDLRQALRIAQGDAAATPITGAPPLETTNVPLENPYKGLRAFQERDRADFYGREASTEQMIRRFEQSAGRFLAIIGPSGSGKSSLVRAGMIPRLRNGTVKGSESWYVTEMMPGSKPFVELEAALLRVASDTPEQLYQLLSEEDGLARALRRILPDDNTHLLLFIDQFEELFTLVESETARVRFIDNLLAALHDAKGRLHVIITLRADFFDRPLYYDNLGNLIRAQSEIVLPLSRDELDSAIRRPAENIGVTFETGLVERIIQDVQEQPGMLPLLQYALTEMFERREGTRMTLASHQVIGGVVGALSKRAEDVYAQLAAPAQASARQLFLRLVTIGEGTEDTRRRVSREEVTTLPFFDAVLDAFGDARLLTFDYDSTTHVPTVEVAHEALIRNWERLREWVRDAREDLRTLARLRLAAAEWLESGEEPSYLARGLRLQEYEQWVDHTTLKLSAEEQRYLNSSIAEEAEQRAREAARKAEEARIARRAQGFQRITVGLGVMVAAALVTVVFSIAAFIRADNQAATATVEQGQALLQVQTADAALSTADSQQTLAANQINDSNATATQVANVASTELAVAVATSERLSTEGSAILLSAQARDLFESDPSLALRLAYEASTVANPPVQSEVILSSLAYAPGIRTNYVGQRDVTSELVLAPNNRQFVSTQLDGTVMLWDIESSEPVRDFVGHTAIVRGADLSSDGTLLVTTSSDQTAILWDMATGDILHTFALNADGYAVAFSPDDTLLAMGTNTDIILWDVETREEVRRLQGEGTANRLDFSPDGTRLASGHLSPTSNVYMWDVASGALQYNTFEGGEVRAITFSQDGAFILVSTESLTAYLDAETGEELQRIMFPEDNMFASTFSPDGTQIIIGTRMGNLVFWDIAMGVEVNRIRFSEGIGNIMPIADTTAVISGVQTTALVLLDSASGVQTQQIDIQVDDQPFPKVFDVHYLPNGNQAISWGLSGLNVWNLDSGEVARELEGPITETGLYLTLSPDGTQAAALVSSGIVLWDVASGTQRPLLPADDRSPFTMQFSPDATQLFVVYDSQTILALDVNSGESVTEWQANLPTVYSLAVSPTGRHFATGHLDGTVQLWDTASNAEPQVLRGHAGIIFSLGFSADGTTLLSGGDDAQLILWDVDTGTQRQRYIGHGGRVYDAAFSPDGAHIVSVSFDGTLIVWDTANGALMRRLEGHQDLVWSVDFAPDGRSVISASLDDTIRVWRYDDLAQLQEWTRDNRYMPVLSCDERALYNLEPCDNGTPPPTPTFQPTAAPDTTN